ncbi:MAG: DNA repair protein RadC [Flavobacteriales bacterium]|nr:DNA repair protein RadC [Flavobacteriales bacterium]
MLHSAPTITIKDWSEEDQPREKLLNKGERALSDAELVAILIGSGSRNESAVALSQRILKSVDNNLQALGKLSLSQLMEFKGIGQAKAITIAAAMELGRRRKDEEPKRLRQITSSQSVFQLMQPILGELPHEEFWIIYMNNSNKVIRKEQLSKGSITGTLVDVRLVYKIALEIFATSIILCHNHPSGKLMPSTADRELTRKLKDAGECLDVKVLDHVIVTQQGYYSFADEGVL